MKIKKILRKRHLRRLKYNLMDKKNICIFFLSIGIGFFIVWFTTSMQDAELREIEYLREVRSGLKDPSSPMRQEFIDEESLQLLRMYKNSL